MATQSRSPSVSVQLTVGGGGSAGGGGTSKNFPTSPAGAHQNARSGGAPNSDPQEKDVPQPLSAKAKPTKNRRRGRVRMGRSTETNEDALSVAGRG